MGQRLTCGEGSAFQSVGRSSDRAQWELLAPFSSQTSGSLVVKIPHLPPQPQILPHLVVFVEPVIPNAEMHIESLPSFAFDSVPNAQKLQFTSAV